MSEADQLIRAASRLAKEVDALSFGAPVTHVYNPLNHASRPHRRFLRRFGDSRKRVLFLGMNPGPYGMTQTGVPFGEVAIVRDWMGIDERVDRPANEHPKRPVDGFDCPRSEVSGARLWGAVAAHWKRPEAFFKEHFLTNYCPLVFMEASGKNRTPDKLPADEREPLYAACNRHLRRVVEIVRPTFIVGIGAFAESRAQTLFGEEPFQFGRVLHPSPASPLANRDWAGAARKDFARLGPMPKIRIRPVTSPPRSAANPCGTESGPQPVSSRAASPTQKEILLIHRLTTQMLVLLLTATLCVGCGQTPANAADEQAVMDSAIQGIDEFIATQPIDREQSRWRTKLAKPPKLKFDPKKTYSWKIETNVGTIVFELLTGVAPMHASSTIYLTRLGFYDSLKFHRVITGFMAQGGDPLGNGRGGPGYKYRGEFSPNALHDKPGTLSMANAGPGTDGSQFFITFRPTPQLNNRHTVFGRAVGAESEKTMRAMEALGRPRDPAPPIEPIFIKRATILIE